MMGPMLSLVVNSIDRFVFYISRTLLILSLLISIAYSLGWVHRFLWYLAETECTKLLNNTMITCGSLRMDLLRGRAWASNVVIHAPKREQWKWESPVLARVGKVYVETNLVLCLLSLWFLWEEQPLELYTIKVSDIQCFVERKQNFFNFFLLDPHVELPDPRELLDEDELVAVALGGTENAADGGDQQQQSPQGDLDTSPDASSSWDVTTDAASSPAEEKAQKLMGDMFRALSRAAKEGSLQGALVEHRQTITRELKALQTTKKKSAAMQEGVKIVQHVSKAVVEKSKTVPQVVQPTRRTLENEPIVMVRIGRILIEDARIFTRDHWEASTGSSGTNKTVSSSKSQPTSWNKPILVQRVSVRPSELCPPLSAKDENGLPALYQTMDKCIEVIWKRVLAEGATTNTGRLFKTAMGEVLEYWMETDKPSGSHDS